MGNAIAVMRVSSERQGFEGDSIEHQKKQIDLYASTRQISIKKYFIFIESASKEQQPIQEAIDYCMNPKNNINTFIIKSIDRFTRGGSSLYDHMKTELSKCGVTLIDIYGVINNQSINTLSHLGIEYPWSVYNPSKKSELLEAERGKDELRDILSRMKGAEIYYTRLGYWIRVAPFGYISKQIETTHGKRFILDPHPQEAGLIKRMFELKAEGALKDYEIIEQINLMGFKSRRYYRRDKTNRNKIIGIKGEVLLNGKTFYRFLSNPIYAGINVEKWTDHKPVKCQFKGLVSLEIFNKVNTGIILIREENGILKITKGKKLERKLREMRINFRYPYKQLILCWEGRHRFYASASRGRNGKQFPAYHCDKKKVGHYYRIPVKQFHATVENYLRDIRIKDQYITKVHKMLSLNQEFEQNNSFQQIQFVKNRLAQIELNIRFIVEKIKLLSSDVALLSLEKELKELGKEKAELFNKQKLLESQNKEEQREKKGFYSNRLPEDLICDYDSIYKNLLFKLLFPQLPTYEELLNKTAKLNPEFNILTY